MTFKHNLCFSIGLVFTIGLFFSSLAHAAPAEDVEYNNPVFPKGFTLEGSFNPETEKVQLRWQPHVTPEFTHYVVVRSVTTKTPMYREDDTILFSIDRGLFLHNDDDVPEENEIYYRVCSLAAPDLFCSDVLTVDKERDTEEWQRENQKEPEGVVLSAEAKRYAIQLQWTHKSGSVGGYKVLRSTTHENPVYPAMDGDMAKHVANSYAANYEDVEIEDGVKYYYRICAYTRGEGCTAYSNTVAIVAQSDTKGISVFEDIRDHWGREYVNALHHDGVVKGVNDTNFDPDRAITRAEFLKIMMMVLFRNEIGNVEAAPFQDVAVKDWFAPYADLAKEKGIVGGYEGGKYFRPHNPITRAEAVKIALSAKGFKEVPMQATGFVDVKEAWQMGYVEKAKDLEIVKGYDATHFGPNDQLTRAQAAKIIFLVKDVLVK